MSALRFTLAVVANGRIAVLLATLAAITVPGPGSQAQERPLNARGSSMYASWAPDSERIAFMSSRDGNYEIYTVRVDGSDLRRLTHNLASDGLPSWSPDGTTIAYASDDTHQSSGNVFFNPRPYAIFLMDADGENKRRLTNLDVGGWRPSWDRYEDTQPVWSPDGRVIAFLSDRRNGYREIFLVDPVTGVERQITNSGVHHNNVTWTPDGLRLLFDARFGEHYDVRRHADWGVFTVEVTDGSADQNRSIAPFINQTDTQIEFDAALSPDSKTIAFVNHSSAPDAINGPSGLFFADTADIPGTMRQRTDESEFWARWSPSGELIAFTSTRDGHREIYVMNADGSNVRRLTHSR